MTHSSGRPFQKLPGGSQRQPATLILKQFPVIQILQPFDMLTDIWLCNIQDFSRF